jgi:hypothetical protein
MDIIDLPPDAWHEVKRLEPPKSWKSRFKAVLWSLALLPYEVVRAFVVGLVRIFATLFEALLIVGLGMAPFVIICVIADFLPLGLQWPFIIGALTLFLLFCMVSDKGSGYPESMGEVAGGDHVDSELACGLTQEPRRSGVVPTGHGGGYRRAG